MANFQSLPPEIRQEIYLLATPARVVHLKTRISRCKHPRCRLLRFYPRNYNLLQDRCPLKQYFYSNAPIPVLLHTCMDSRAFLMNKGYQLAFKTNTQGPRTWFNYDRDVLFKDERSLNVVQLDADETARVRRLALGYCTGYLYSPIQYAQPPALHPCEQDCLYPLIEDFPALEEILLVDWNRHTFPGELTNNTDYHVNSPSKRHRYDTTNLWKCVKVEDSSLLRTMHHHYLSAYDGPGIIRPFGYGTAPNITDWGTFGNRSAYRLLELAICRKSQKHPVGDWRAPKRITPVHLIDERQEEILQQKQKIALDELRRLRKFWAPALKERKERIDAGGGVISERELKYLWAYRWEIICWIEKDIFS